jgi:hypothetical protein
MTAQKRDVPHRRLIALDRSPTSERRRYYPDRSTPPKEHVPMSKSKNVAWIVAGTVTALTAAIVVADQFNSLMGRRWW